MGLLDSFGFDNIELWRSEEMQLVQVCWFETATAGCYVQLQKNMHRHTCLCCMALCTCDEVACAWEQSCLYQHTAAECAEASNSSSFCS
jgi:hypothetical protein